MPASPVRSSLLALALTLVGVGTAAAAPAAECATGVVARLGDGLRYLERVLHLQQKGDPVVGHGVSLSGREAVLRLDLASGAEYAVTLRGGQVLIGGAPVASYAVGGPLDLGWRRYVAGVASLSEPDLLASTRRWTVAGLTGEDAAAQGHRVLRPRREVQSQHGLAAGQGHAVADYGVALLLQMQDALEVAQAVAKARDHAGCALRRRRGRRRAGAHQRERQRQQARANGRRWHRSSEVP